MTKMKDTIVLVGLAAYAAAAYAAPIPSARRAACAARARELVAQMTAEERLGLMMMDSPALERLGIPKYHWWNEALHGLARDGVATVFPQSMGAAAGFDRELERRVADAISTEARAKYNVYSARGRRGIFAGLTLWGPNVNMFRDPRWGRGQETFGEDPFLSAEIGCAFVRGLQGDDPNYLKAAACAKHFAVHSGPEALRLSFSAKVSPKDMAEYYLPAFRALVREAGVEAVMGAYSAINGTPCCANRWLLTDLLRGEWGFRGHVVGDVGAVYRLTASHRFRDSEVTASLAAMEAGLDLCSDGSYGHLRPKVADGSLDSARLVEPLVRLMTTRILLGQLDPSGSTPWDRLDLSVVANEEHRNLALESAEKSIVLLQNRGGVLPLGPETLKKGMLVTGPLMTEEMALLGNYSGISSDPVTCLTGLVRETDDAECPISIESSAEFGTVVYCVGLTPRIEGEANSGGGDRVRYALPEGQLDELRGLTRQRNGRKFVGVVFGCSPIDLSELAELCDAVLLAWYPGEQGGRAIARTILGKSNPAGRLPITYPRSYDDLPPFESYALEGRTYRYAVKEPLYPFGFGLSYTTFGYANLRLERSGERVMASVDVTNTGSRAGDEVVQLYLRAPAGSGDRRRHRLAGFERVPLAVGETKRVTMALSREQFAVYGEDGRPVVPKGATTVFVGGGQPGFAPCLSGAIE